MAWGLTVAVRTQEPEIFWPVISPVSVDVVNLKSDWFTQPHGYNGATITLTLVKPPRLQKGSPKTKRVLTPFPQRLVYQYLLPRGFARTTFMQSPRIGSLPRKMAGINAEFSDGFRQMGMDTSYLPSPKIPENTCHGDVLFD